MERPELMINNIIFRNFKKTDIEGVYELWEKTGLWNVLRGDDLDTIELSLKMGGKFIIMEDVLNSKIIGTSWITFDGRRLHLHHFGVDPDYQGKKLSKPLLKKTLLFAKKKGVQIKLEVHKDNFKAIELYTKNGFEYLGDYRIYIIRDLSVISLPDSFQE